MSQGEKTKLLWQDPEYRKRMSELHRHPISESHKKNIAKAVKKRMQPKHIREKFSRLWKGKNNPRWKGGQYTDKDGYVYILKPSHPLARKNGYIKRCNLVMEKKIGRYLTPEEIVHHRNSIRNDDRIKNLKLFPNHKSHISFHSKIRNPKGSMWGANAKKVNLNLVPLS